MKPLSGKVFVAVAAAVVLAACGSSQPMTFAEAQATAKAIVKPVLADLAPLTAAAGDMNAVAVKTGARKLSADSKTAEAKLRAVSWPASYKQRAERGENLLADVAACMDAVASATGMLEMSEVISQGSSCRAVSKLKQGE